MAEGEGRGRGLRPGPPPAPPARRLLILSRRPASHCPGPSGGLAPGSTQVRGPFSHGHGGRESARFRDGGKKTHTETPPGERQTQRQTQKRRTDPETDPTEKGRDTSMGTEGHTAMKKEGETLETHMLIQRYTKRQTGRERRHTTETLRHSEMGTHSQLHKLEGVQRQMHTSVEETERHADMYLTWRDSPTERSHLGAQPWIHRPTHTCQGLHKVPSM